MCRTPLWQGGSPWGSRGHGQPGVLLGMNPPCSGQGESSQAAGAGCLPPPCASRDASSGISKQTQGPRASPELLAGCPCCPTARTACKDSRDTRHRSDFKPPALQCSLAPSPPRWVAQGRAPRCHTDMDLWRAGACKKGSTGRSLRASHQELHTLPRAGTRARDLPLLSTPQDGPRFP